MGEGEGERGSSRAVLWGAVAALVVVGVALMIAGHGPIGTAIAILAALAAVAIGLLGGGARR